ncbi:hypothetical protein D3C87_2007890 [compost metagenome]
MGQEEFNEPEVGVRIGQCRCQDRLKGSSDAGEIYDLEDKTALEQQHEYTQIERYAAQL